MSNWIKVKGIESKDVNRGCLCCPSPTIVAEMEKWIAVGFGFAGVTKDGDLVYMESSDLDECWTFQDAENLALKNPDHDWRVTMDGPLHGETYQRHDTGTWVVIESNRGFA